MPGFARNPHADPHAVDAVGAYRDSLAAQGYATRGSDSGQVRLDVSLRDDVMVQAAIWINADAGLTPKRRDRHDYLRVFSIQMEDGAHLHKAAEPMLVSFDYDPDEFSEIVDESLHLLWFNPETGEIEPLATEVDVVNHRLTAVTDKLGTFAVDGEDAGWISPAIEAFDVALSKGSASYSYDLPLPKGPNGFGPSLPLRYNSGIVNGLASDDATDTNWVGLGWSMDLGRISGDQITLNGVSERMIEGADGTFYTERQAFLKIERFDRNLQSPNSGCVTVDGAYWWRVTDQQGTQYYFGTDNAGNGSTLAYLKHADGKWRWRHRVYKLYKVVDTFGNTMKVIYDNNHFGNEECGVYPLAQSYPLRIEYTTNSGAQDNHAEHVVEFAIASKGYSLLDYTHGPRYGDSDYKLTRVSTYYQPLSGARQLIRQVKFAYDTNVPDKTNKLVSLEITDDRGGTSNEDTLPKTEFHYVNHDIGRYWVTRVCQQTNDCRFCSSTPHHATYTRAFLDRVDNNYGGTIDFNYTTQSWQGHTIFKRVSSRLLIDAVTNTTSQFNYNYGTAHFVPDGHSSNPACNWVSQTLDYGDFYGYPSAVVVDPLGNRTQHLYDNSYDAGHEQPGILNGKELETKSFGAGQTHPLRVVKNEWTYAHHSSWPAGVHFVYLNATESFHCEAQTSQTADCVSQRTEFDYNLQYGHQLAKREYDQNGLLLRTSTFGYKKHPTKWLFRKTFENLYRGAAGTGLESSVWFSYDNKPKFDTPMSSADRGILTALRRYHSSNNGTRFFDTRYWYDAYGNQTRETMYNGLGTETTYANYDPRSTHTTYDADHGLLAVAVENALGHITKARYNMKFQVPLVETNAAGRDTVHTYDHFGRRRTTRLPDEEPNRFTTVLMLSEQASHGPSHPFFRQQRRHLGGGVYSDGYTFYNGFGKKIQVHSTGDSGNRWQVQYLQRDGLGRATRESVTYAKDNPNIHQFLAPVWSTLAYTATTYDGIGRIKTMTEPNGEQTVHHYMRDTNGAGYQGTGGLLHVRVDEKGHARHQVTDPFGNLIRLRDFSGNSNSNYSLYGETSYSYDIRANLVGIVDDQGNTTAYSYDALGRMTEMDDPDTGLWRYTHNVVGNVVDQIDARGVRTSMWYDDLGRVTRKTWSKPAGVAQSDPVTYTYDQTADGIGHLTQMDDADGSTLLLRYDPRGRVVRRIRRFAGRFAGLDQPDDYEVRTLYDTADRVVQQKYPDGEIVRTGYSKRHLPTRMDAYQPIRRDAFEGSSLPAGWTKSGSVSVSNSRVRVAGNGTWSTDVKRQDPVGDRTAANFTFMIDHDRPSGHYMFSTGSWTQPSYKRWSLTVSNGYLRLQTYDGTQTTNEPLIPFKRGVWYEATLVIGGTGAFEVEVHELYNPQITKTITKTKSGWSGKSWRFRHQLKTGVSYLLDYHELDTRPTKSQLITEAAYNPSGMNTRWRAGVVGGSIITNTSYHTAAADNMRVKNIRAGNLIDFDYTYDAVGNVASIQDNVLSQHLAFEYDHLDRLSRARTSGSAAGGFDFDYSYNSIGNLTARANRVYSYGNGRPHAVSSVTGVASYAYDAVGNMKKRTRVSDGRQFMYTYNGENKLYLMRDATTNQMHRHFVDGKGRLLVRNADETYTVFIDNLYEKTDGDVVKYYYFNGKRLAMRRNGQINFFHADHLGSLVLTTRNGAAVNRQRSYPFGQRRWNSGTPQTDFEFTDQRKEAHFGVLDYGARFYDPEIGRFLSPDSLIPDFNDSQALNRYSYVGNNPLRYSDPSGHDGFDVIDRLGAWVGFMSKSASAVSSPPQTVDQSIQTAAELSTSTTQVLYQVHQSVEMAFLKEAGDAYFRSGSQSMLDMAGEASRNIRSAQNMIDTVGAVGTAYDIAKTGADVANTLVAYDAGEIHRMEAQAQLFVSGANTAVTLAGNYPVTKGAALVFSIEEAAVKGARDLGWIDDRPSALETAGMIYAVGTEWLFGDRELVEQVIFGE